MGITAILFLVLFVLPIGGGIFLFRRSKKRAIILFSIPTFIVLCIVGWIVFEQNHHFVRSTNLSTEKIGELSFQQPMGNEIIEEFGSYTKADNVYYKDFYDFHQVSIGTNTHDQIIYISTRKPTMATEKGITVGNSIQEVISTYGDNYYRTSDMGMWDGINYVDRKNNILLQFRYVNESKITEIVLTTSK